jgi:predicted DNA-binding transcriptional regulator AlpA
VTVWYTFESIAKELGIPVKTIYFFHKKGVGPRVHKFGKHLRVLEDDYSAWKTKQVVNKS